MLQLPDIADVLKDHFYCPRCENKLRIIDSCATLELYKRRQHRRKFIRTHGEKQYRIFLSILELTTEQLNEDLPVHFSG